MAGNSGEVICAPARTGCGSSTCTINRAVKCFQPLLVCAENVHKSLVILVPFAAIDRYPAWRSPVVTPFRLERNDGARGGAKLLDNPKVRKDHCAVQRGVAVVRLQLLPRAAREQQAHNVLAAKLACEPKGRRAEPSRLQIDGRAAAAAPAKNAVKKRLCNVAVA